MKNKTQILSTAHCAVILFALLLFLPIGGCDSDTPDEQPIIRLDNLSPIPKISSPEEPEILRVAVAAILSPQGTIQSYQPFLDYLAKKTNKKTVLIQRKTYQEVNDMLARGVVDVAFVCTGAYFEGKSQGTMELLVVPQVNGKRTYQALFIVPKDSLIKSIQELQGKVFAFTDPLSNTGYLYPISALQKLGQKPEIFFSHSIFTYSHDRSIDAVIEGVADGASVDNIIYEFAKTMDPQIARSTKVIHRSPEFGMPPVVVPKQLAPQTAALLRDIFLSAHTDPEGMKSLGGMGVERFVKPDKQLYRSLESL